MPHHEETVLSTLHSTLAGERVAIVLCRRPSGESVVELRQQSWGEGLGWFTQSSVQLEPQQVAELRSVVGATGLVAGPRRSPAATPPWSPRVVHADSA